MSFATISRNRFFMLTMKCCQLEIVLGKFWRKIWTWTVWCSEKIEDIVSRNVNKIKIDDSLTKLMIRNVVFWNDKFTAMLCKMSIDAWKMKILCFRKFSPLFTLLRWKEFFENWMFCEINVKTNLIICTKNKKMLSILTNFIFFRFVTMTWINFHSMKFFAHRAFDFKFRNLTFDWSMINFRAIATFDEWAILIFDVIVNSTSKTVFDFVIFDKFFTRVYFVVLDEIISNDFVNRFRKTKFNYRNCLFRFLKKKFQSIHIINFFGNQRRDAKNVCCYQNLKGFWFFDIVAEIDIFDSNEMH